MMRTLFFSLLALFTIVPRASNAQEILGKWVLEKHEVLDGFPSEMHKMGFQFLMDKEIGEMYFHFKADSVESGTRNRPANHFAVHWIDDRTFYIQATENQADTVFHTIVPLNDQKIQLLHSNSEDLIYLLRANNN